MWDAVFESRESRVENYDSREAYDDGMWDFFFIEREKKRLELWGPFR